MLKQEVKERLQKEEQKCCCLRNPANHLQDSDKWDSTLKLPPEQNEGQRSWWKKEKSGMQRDEEIE